MPIARRRSSFPDSPGRRKRALRSLPYHRDDLRGDLLAAARRHVVRHGHAGLSIRLLAQATGVSPGAPYHHFPDRRSILLALAIQGFEDMMQATAAATDGKLRPREQLRRLGLVFIQFADDNPQLIELMYESELTTPALDPALLAYQQQGHGLLVSVTRAALPRLSEREIELRVIAFWSAIYGFTSMRRKGVLHPHRPDLLPTLDIAPALVDRAVQSALDGARVKVRASRRSRRTSRTT